MRKWSFLYRGKGLEAIFTKEFLWIFCYDENNGDGGSSLEMLQEILENVDPLDSKALNQLGELQENSGKLNEAILSFSKATQFGAPQGRIAAFRAGYLLEKQQHYDMARQYYFKSLQFWPKGISPLKGLIRVADKTKDRYLRNWAKVEMKKYE